MKKIITIIITCGLITLYVANSRLEKQAQDMFPRVKQVAVTNTTRHNKKKNTDNREARNIELLIKKLNKDADVKTLSNLFVDVAKTYKIPVEILLAVAWQESHFKIYATSKSGCIGIMQVNPQVWGIVDDSILYNPVVNIQIGAGILKYYYEQTGSWEHALYRYYGISQFGFEYKNQVKSKIKLIKKELDNASKTKKLI